MPNRKTKADWYLLIEKLIGFFLIGINLKRF